MVRLIYSVQTYISPQQGNTIKTQSKYTMTRKQRSNHQTSPKYNHNATPKCNSNTPKIYNIIEILVSPCPILNNFLPPSFSMWLTQSRRNIPAIGWLLLIQCPIRFPPSTCETERTSFFYTSGLLAWCSASGFEYNTGVWYNIHSVLMSIVW